MTLLTVKSCDDISYVELAAAANRWCIEAKRNRGAFLMASWMAGIFFVVSIVLGLLLVFRLGGV